MPKPMEVLSITEVAKALDITTPSAIYALKEHGPDPVAKTEGGRVFYKRTDITKFKRERAKAAKARARKKK